MLYKGKKKRFFLKIKLNLKINNFFVSKFGRKLIYGLKESL